MAQQSELVAKELCVNQAPFPSICINHSGNISRNVSRGPQNTIIPFSNI
jgi:hypothetical protein